MPDYSKGQIYAIRNRNDAIKIYIGSTIQPLYKRFHKHKEDSKKEKHINIKLYKEVNGDWTNWYIELYENYPCKNRDELNKREGEIIREIGTLNTNIAGRDDKQYYIDNKDKILKHNKEYYIQNIDKINEQKREYMKQNYIENADKIKEKQKQYYTKNADKINERVKQNYFKKKYEKLEESII